MTLASTISVGPTIPKGQKQLGKDSRHNKRKKLPAKSKSLLQQTDQQTNLSDRYAGESECQSHKDCKQGRRVQLPVATQTFTTKIIEKLKTIPHLLNIEKHLYFHS